MIFQGPKGLGNPHSLSVGTGWYSTSAVILVRDPMVLVSLISWSLHCNSSCTITLPVGWSRYTAVVILNAQREDTRELLNLGLTPLFGKGNLANT